MTRLAGWIELNLAGWSTSIALGYLLGFVPVIARFFGIPFDVRHVTLSDRHFGPGGRPVWHQFFGHDWFYYAMAGIGVTFVLNLGVSFSIASFVALRAYDVRAREQFAASLSAAADCALSVEIHFPSGAGGPARSQFSPLCLKKEIERGKDKTFPRKSYPHRDLSTALWSRVTKGRGALPWRVVVKWKHAFITLD